MLFETLVASTFGRDPKGFQLYKVEANRDRSLASCSLKSVEMFHRMCNILEERGEF